MIPRMRLVREIQLALDTVHAHSVGQHWSDTEWTRHVKTALCTACRDTCERTPRQIKLFASGVKGVDGGEWMFDVTCLLYDRETGCLRRMPMVAESEWRGKADVSDDFQKLLIARADVRVMVLARGHWDTDADMMADLAKYVRAYDSPQSSGICLIAGWEIATGFKYWRIAANGTHQFIR